MKLKTKVMSKDKIKGCVWGSICGDVLGVPVEFRDRKYLQKYPITKIIGFETTKESKHVLVPGTWSDDTSLSLLTIESLLNGYNPKDMMNLYSLWFYKSYMTAHGELFDIGITTEKAIKNFINKKAPYGLKTEKNNGNGSLMRIHPIAIYFANESDDKIILKAFQISELTHGHIRSKLACAYFCILLKQILHGKSFIDSYKYTNDAMKDLIIKRGEFKAFERILTIKILNEPVIKINSGGYVIDTLEASLWCIYNTKTLKSAILKAVNLGFDSDTTGSVTGALAGAIYGYNDIPKEWIDTIVKKEMIEKLINKFLKKTS